MSIKVTYDWSVRVYQHIPKKSNYPDQTFTSSYLYVYYRENEWDLDLKNLVMEVLVYTDNSGVYKLYDCYLLIYLSVL